MSINQSVHTWFGWKIIVTPEIRQWIDDIDGPLPPGFMIMDPDSQDIIVGVELFNSGCSRWLPMCGCESFTQNSAKALLLDFYEQQNMDLFQDHLRKQQAEFFSFVRNS